MKSKIKEKVLKKFPEEVTKKKFQEYIIHRGVSDLIIDLTLAEVSKVIDDMIEQDYMNSTGVLLDNPIKQVLQELKQKLGIK